MILLRLALCIRSILSGWLDKRPLQVRSSTGQWTPLKRASDWPETLREAPANRLVGIRLGNDYWAVMFDQGVEVTRMLIFKGRQALSQSGFNRKYQLVGMMSGPFHKYRNELCDSLAVSLLVRYLRVDVKSGHVGLQVAVSEAQSFPLPRVKQSRVLCQSHGHA